MSSQNVNFNLKHFLLQVVDFISSSTTYKNSVFLLSFTPNTIFPMLHEAFDNGWQNLKIVNLILYNLNKKFTKKIRLSDTTFELPLLETIQQSICDIIGLEIWTDHFIKSPNNSFNACCQEPFIYYAECTNNDANDKPLGPSQSDMSDCNSSIATDNDTDLQLNSQELSIPPENSKKLKDQNMSVLSKHQSPSCSNAGNVNNQNQNESVDIKSSKPEGISDEPVMKKPKLSKCADSKNKSKNSKTNKNTKLNAKGSSSSESSQGKVELEFKNTLAQKEHDLQKKVNTLMGGLSKLNQIVHMILSEVYHVTNSDFYKYWTANSSFENTLSGGINICEKLNKLPKKRGRPPKIND